MNRRSDSIVILVLLLSLCACAKRPVLYPNDYLNDVGAATSQRDIDECIALAESADLDRNETLEAGKKTAGGAAVGGAAGAVGGAITGRPGQGAAVGAATGAVGGFFAWLFGSGERDPVFKRYVDTCLTERGYQPIGWK